VRILNIGNKAYVFVDDEMAANFISSLARPANYTLREAVHITEPPKVVGYIIAGHVSDYYLGGYAFVTVANVNAPPYPFTAPTVCGYITGATKIEAVKNLAAQWNTLAKASILPKHKPPCEFPETIGGSLLEHGRARLNFDPVGKVTWNERLVAGMRQVQSAPPYGGKGGQLWTVNFDMYPKFEGQISGSELSFDYTPDAPQQAGM
jgi:hypothetical protein